MPFILQVLFPRDSACLSILPAPQPSLLMVVFCPSGAPVSSSQSLSLIANSRLGVPHPCVCWALLWPHFVHGGHVPKCPSCTLQSHNLQNCLCLLSTGHTESGTVGAVFSGFHSEGCVNCPPEVVPFTARGQLPCATLLTSLCGLSSCDNCT